MVSTGDGTRAAKEGTEPTGARPSPAPIKPGNELESGLQARTAPLEPTKKVPVSPGWAPAEGKVQVAKGDDGSLNISIPAAGFLASRGGSSSPAVLLTFAAVWIVAVSAIPILVVLWGSSSWVILIVVPFYFFALFLIGFAMRIACLKERLSFGKKQFTIEKDLLGWKSVVVGSCKDIVALDLKIMRQFQQIAGFVIRETKPATWCYFVEGVKERTFGHYLTSPEQQHILREMSHYLKVPLGTGTLAPSAFV